MTVGVYVLVTVGVVCISVLNSGPRMPGLAMASPFIGLGMMTLVATTPAAPSEFEVVSWAVVWTVASALVAIGLLLAVMAGFDRRLGRMESAVSRIAQPPRPVRIATTIYFCAAAIVFLFGIPSAAGWESVLVVTPTIFTLGKLLLCARAAGSLDDRRWGEHGTLPSAVEIPALPVIISRWLAAYSMVPPILLLIVLPVLLRGDPSVIAEPQLIVTMMLMLLQSAAVVSFGVAMAAWLGGRGRAVLVSIAFWALFDIVGILATGRGGILAFTLGFAASGLQAVALVPLQVRSAWEWLTNDLLLFVCLWSLGYGLAALALLRFAIAAFERSIKRGPP